MSASGTATLQIALIGTPLVVVYKMAPLTFRIVRRLVHIPDVALCNIVAGRRVAAELLQDEANPQRIAEEIERLLVDAPHRQAVLAGLATVHEKLGGGDGTQSVGELALELLSAPPVLQLSDNAAA